MAARKVSLQLDDRWRSKIQTSMLINRLTDFATAAEPDPNDEREVKAFRKVNMTSTQVTAALGLLRKTLPDLVAAEIKGEVQKTYVVRAPVAGDDWEEWKNNFQPTTIDQDGKNLN